MTPPTAQEVAEHLVGISYEKQNPVSNLKLQKLLYYSQAWHLALSKVPLFAEEIEAWAHGPVVPQVFRYYKDCKWNPISRPALGQKPSYVLHLEEVWRVYGKFRAFDLERLTHSEDPWKIARAGLPPDASSNRVISKSSMQEYYSSRLNG
jgi:uncharacterized phage-associated protein